MAKILIVGKTFSENVEHIKKSGHQVFLLKDTNADEEDFRALDDYDGIYNMDFSSDEKLLESLKAANITEADGIIATYERFISPKSIIGNYLGLRVPSVEAAKAVTDKHLQRSLYNKFDKSISPNFRLVKSNQDIISFCSEFNLPVILKPTNLLKSLFVKKCTTQEEAIEYFNANKDKLIQVYEEEQMYGREPQFLVEEFLDGSGHSIEVFMDDDGDVHISNDVVDVLKAKDIGIDDNFEYCRVLPSRLSPEVKQSIKDVAVRGMKALNLRNSPGHVEIMLTQEGPKIIEINGRIGGYRDRMFTYTFGISLIDKEVDLVLGNKIEFPQNKNGYTAVFELFPEKTGILKKVENEIEIEKLASFKYYACPRKEGVEIGLAKDGHRYTAIVIISNLDKTQFDKDYEFIKNKVKVLVE